MLYFSHCITHFFLLLVSAVISLSLNQSFILTQSVAPWEGVSASVVVLAQVAKHNMSPASASLSAPSLYLGHRQAEQVSYLGQLTHWRSLSHKELHII